MKVAIADVYNASPVVSENYDRPEFKGELNWRLVRLNRMITEEMEAIDTTLSKLAMEFGKKDEDGNLEVSHTEDGRVNVKIREDSREEYFEQINSFMSKELEINFEPIPAELFFEHNVSAATLDGFGPFIKD